MIYFSPMQSVPLGKAGEKVNSIHFGQHTGGLAQWEPVPPSFKGCKLAQVWEMVAGP